MTHEGWLEDRIRIAIGALGIALFPSAGLLYILAGAGPGAFVLLSLMALGLVAFAIVSEPWARVSTGRLKQQPRSREAAHGRLLWG